MSCEVKRATKHVGINNFRLPDTPQLREKNAAR
jgi:hypothetical protein